MRSAHPKERPSCFSVSPEQAAELLLELESVAFDGRVRVDSELGAGEIQICGGNLTSAYFGAEIGRPALQRLLSLPNATWTVEGCRVAEAAPLVAGVDVLVTGDELRKKHWDVLCSGAPPGGSVLQLTPAGERARDSSSGLVRKLLARIDGRRTLMQVLEECGLDPIDAMAGLLDAIKSGLVLASTRANSLFPLAATADSSGLVPRGPSSSLNASAHEMDGALGQHSKPGLSHSDRAFVLGVAGATGLQSNSLSVESEGSSSYVSEEITTGVEPSRVRFRHFIGRYEIIMRIGRGGMGTVYLSRMSSEEAGFRRLVALKLLRSHLCRDAQAARDFLDEARLAGAIHHAHVVGVSDAGVHGQQPYLVMEYVEGTSLKQLMMDGRSRDPRFLIPIVMDALAGLHAVHRLRGDDGRSLGLVHCDVSPENILVGVDGISRLADFGVVRRASGVKGANLRGKLGYVAPEQMAGQVFDHRADIYAMGVVLWNSLTGKDIGTRIGGGDERSNLHNLELPSPSEIGAKSSRELDRIVMRALALAAHERFETAEHMLTELHAAALAGDGLATAPELSSWVRQVAGHELATRRLAVIEATRHVDADSREFPSPSWLLPAEPDAAAREPAVSGQRISLCEASDLAGRLCSSHSIGVEATTPSAGSTVQKSRPPEVPETLARLSAYPAIKGLFYGAEALLDAPSMDSDSQEPQSDTASERSRQCSVRAAARLRLNRRTIVVAAALMFGVLAGYIAMCASLPWLRKGFDAPSSSRSSK